MSLDKLWTKSRADRLTDPAIQTALKLERDKVIQSFRNLGHQTKETAVAIPYNTFIRPFVSVKRDKKNIIAPGNQMLAGAVDSGNNVLKLVARILLSTGRATKYGIRKAIVL